MKKTLLRFWEPVAKIFQPNLFEVSIWFVSEEIKSETMKTKIKSKKVFRMRRIDKLTQNQLIGISNDNSRIELRCTEKFDYELKKIN